MKKLLIIGFIAIGTLNAAASNSDVQADSSASLITKYTNHDVDATVRKNWYAFNEEYKDARDQIVLDELHDERKKELARIEWLFAAKKGINYFERQKLQAQRAEIARLQAERDRLQRLYEQGQRVPIVVPFAQRHR